MQIVNLTPHEITLCGTKYPSAGEARVAVTERQVGELNGIPIVQEVYGDVTGLPEPVDGVVYVVSLLVLQRCAGRSDVYGLTRFHRLNGVIVGAHALKQ